MALSVVRCSSLIETLEQAREYYEAKWVGDHRIECRGIEIHVRFNREEIHLFSDSIRAGTRPDPAKLVQRVGPGGETRYFSLVRARLLDEIVPTICAPMRSIRADKGVLLIGPPRLEASQRLAVVVAPAGSGNVYYVRTAFPLTPVDFKHKMQQQQRATPWPPK